MILTANASVVIKSFVTDQRLDTGVALHGNRHESPFSCSRSSLARAPTFAQGPKRSVSATPHA